MPLSDGERFIVPLLGTWLHRTITEMLPADGRTRRVLDVGCGRQPFRGLVQGRGAAYLSMDALQSPEGTVDHVAPIDGPLPDGLTRSGPFDVLLCTEVLEHVADWHVAFANLASLCTPGGVIILTCPQFYPPHEEPYDFWRPTPNAIRWHAERVGLVVEELVRAGNVWDVIGTAVGQYDYLPATRRPSDRLLAWLTRRVVRAWFLRAVSGTWQKRVVVRHRYPRYLGDFHLSNLAVLRKPQ